MPHNISESVQIIFTDGAKSMKSYYLAACFLLMFFNYVSSILIKNCSYLTGTNLYYVRSAALLTKDITKAMCRPQQSCETISLRIYSLHIIT